MQPKKHNRTGADSTKSESRNCDYVHKDQSKDHPTAFVQKFCAHKHEQSFVNHLCSYKAQGSKTQKTFCTTGHDKQSP